MAPDGHAKNFSLLLLSDIVRLAPLYDIASGVPYTKNFGELRYKRAAMRIGGENHFGSLTATHLKRLAKRNGFDESWAIEQFRQMATDIPGAMEEVFDETAHITSVMSLREVMLAPLSSYCLKAAQALR
jgi:serine/threonine-protein kinase HipA